MNVFLIVLIVILTIVVNFIYASLMKNAYIQKGYKDDFKIFIFCFLFGILGGLYIISLPDLIVHSQNHQIIELLGDKKHE